MASKRWIIGLAVILGAVVLLGLVLAKTIWDWLAAEPEWNPAYFSPEMQERYATPELCYEEYIAALQATDATLYHQVLGYDDPDVDEFPRYEGPVPPIVTLVVDGDRAFIVNANRWEVNLRYVNGRWVFQRETWPWSR